MFRNFKAQLLAGIIYTFITGILFGVSYIMLEVNVHKYINIIYFVTLILLFIFDILYFKTLFKRLDFQDKLNSIYTDID